MRRVLSAIALVFIFCGLALSSDLPKPVGRVNDFAHMLSASASQELESKLADFESKTTTQIAVVSVDSLNGEDVEGYANRLFREWGIGQKGKNNGVLFLFTKTDRRTRIEVGRGLEGVLPDAICKRILANEVRPRFKTGKFDEGTAVAVESIMKAVRGEYTAPPESTIGDYSNWPWWVWWLIIIIVIVIIIAAAASDGGLSGGGYYGGGGDSSESDGGGTNFGGGDSGGGGASDGY